MCLLVCTYATVEGQQTPELCAHSKQGTQEHFSKPGQNRLYNIYLQLTPAKNNVTSSQLSNK